MDIFPYPVQYIVASYLCLELTEIPYIIKLYTDSEYTNTQLEGLYWYGKKEKLCDIAAARYGNLRLLKAIHGAKKPLHSFTLTAAATYGDLEIMKWLYEVAKCPLTSTVFEFAAWKGSLGNMKWLLEIGCPFVRDAIDYDNDTFGYAALNGNLDNMKWLYDVGCPFDLMTYAFAGAYGSIENLEWIYSKGHPIEAGSPVFIHCENNIEVMTWLYDRGGQWTENSFCCIIANAIKNGSTDGLDWVLEKGCPWQIEEVEECINYHGPSPIVEAWVIKNLK